MDLTILGSLLSSYLGVQAFKYGRAAREKGNKLSATLYFGAGVTDFGVAVACGFGALLGKGIPFSLQVGLAVGTLATLMAVSGAVFEKMHAKKNH